MRGSSPSGGFRAGIGWDIHPFAKRADKRPLMLGGAAIPHDRGLAGHSDADVVLHAICDAVLGALGEGDMGGRYPDTDARFRGMASIEFLRDTVRLMRRRGYTIGNVDIVVVAESPKIAPHAAAMKEAIASGLGCGAEFVNVKAKRAEGLGALGRREGIACQAVALLIQSPAKAESRTRGPGRRA